QGNPNWSASWALFSAVIIVVISARSNDGGPMLQISGEGVTIWEQYAVRWQSLNNRQIPIYLPGSNLAAIWCLGCPDSVNFDGSGARANSAPRSSARRVRRCGRVGFSKAEDALRRERLGFDPRGSSICVRTESWSGGRFFAGSFPNDPGIVEVGHPGQLIRH